MRYDEGLIRKVKSEAEEWLFRIPGVYGVALGPKQVRGELTTDLAIQVFVRNKRPLDKIPPGECIPCEIKGIKTDVIVGCVPVSAVGTAPATFRLCPTGTISAVSKTNPVVVTTDSHELSTGDEVTIVGVDGINTEALKIEKTEGDNTTFTIPSVDRTSATKYVDGGIWFKVCRSTNPCCCPGGKITEALNTNPVEMKTDPPHGLRAGQRIRIDKIEGMFQIRNKEFTIKKVVDPTTLLLDVDGTTFRSATHENGEWSQVCIAPTGPITTVSLGNPIEVTSAQHGLATDDLVHIFGVFDVDGKIHSGLNSGSRGDPFVVGQITPDTFQLKGVNGAGVKQAKPGGVWIKITEDKGKYDRLRGGIRLALYKEESITTSVTTSQNQITESGHTVTQLNYGTLGCLAKDNLLPDNSPDKIVLLSNYHVLAAIPDNEDVHHPSYSKCKSQKIGERLTNRSVDHGTGATQQGIADAAIAKLKSKRGRSTPQGDPVIVDIGPVKGSVAIALSDIEVNDRKRGYRVRKRGVTTLLTEGIVTSITGTFNVDETKIYLKDQIIITPMAGAGRGTFAAKGDSGAAVVNDKNEVVGLLAGVDPIGFGFASPIKEIESNLKVTVWKDDPSPSSAPTQPQQPQQPVTVTAAFPEVLAEVTSEVLSTNTGARYVALAQQHFNEIDTLIHQNRRVAATWRRNEGPAFLLELQRFIEIRNAPLPAIIKGKPLVECLEKIVAAFKKFGSPRLVADIDTFTPEAYRRINMSYLEMLRSLNATGTA
jgi:hypothetical protein